MISGELYELRAELHSDKRDRRKDAVRKVKQTLFFFLKRNSFFCFSLIKVISIMTAGKDVSQLFPDVISCMQTDNLELKKLVYLYLINYAKGQPDMAVLAVATLLRVISILFFRINERSLSFLRKSFFSLSFVRLMNSIDLNKLNILSNHRATIRFRLETIRIVFLSKQTKKNKAFI